ncbi:hypothetical protein DFJ73DRAFT_319714 [Zopfochytrium polystomum]|nr:hypothetical protein DFJ73DRAFT_319714 [Zopfochytrium polystomum]
MAELSKHEELLQSLVETLSGPEEVTPKSTRSTESGQREKKPRPSSARSAPVAPPTVLSAKPARPASAGASFAGPGSDMDVMRKKDIGGFLINESKAPTDKARHAQHRPMFPRDHGNPLYLRELTSIKTSHLLAAVVGGTDEVRTEERQDSFESVAAPGRVTFATVPLQRPMSAPGGGAGPNRPQTPRGPRRSRPGSGASFGGSIGGDWSCWDSDCDSKDDVEGCANGEVDGDDELFGQLEGDSSQTVQRETRKEAARSSPSRSPSRLSQSCRPHSALSSTTRRRPKHARGGFGAQTLETRRLEDGGTVLTAMVKRRRRGCGAGGGGVIMAGGAGSIAVGLAGLADPSTRSGPRPKPVAPSFVATPAAQQQQGRGQLTQAGSKGGGNK